MCGIVGVWHRDGAAIDPSVVERMLDTVRHRGPDDHGTFFDGPLALAHRRLSVIDVSAGGHQPMTSADGRFALTYNGEIYNYHELASRYLKGVRLRSSSDTEVLLELLARRGIGVLSELRGMFALALWDTRDRELFLARGPFGKKPLYYAVVGRAIVFGSEVKALLKHPRVSRELDQTALAKYFLYEYVPSPATGYRDIRAVPAGHYLRITSSELTSHCWWQPHFTPKHTVTESEALEHLDARLTTAVQRRMVADVPVGLFLSGGVDSTTIGWYMSQHASGQVHSFSASFEEASFDESSYAQQAARALGTEHHHTTFSLSEFHRVLDRLVSLMDIPFADASLFPTYAVSELARSRVTVALDGDGSDELFGGYGTFFAAEVSERLSVVPSGLWRGLNRLAQWLPTRHTYFSLDFKIKSFLRGMSYPLPRRHQIWLGSFSDRAVAQLLTPEWTDVVASLFADIDDLEPCLSHLSVMDRVSFLALHHYMHNLILTKLDRATMFVSLEARTPFLDVDLVDYVLRLPVHLKREKYLLKRLMRGRIPDAILDRSKQGFGVPLGLWLRGPLFDWAQRVLAPDRVGAVGIIQPEMVSRLLDEHRRGGADHRKQLWTLLMFQLWYERWIVS